MKVFITGSTGLLGSTLLRLAPKDIILGATYNINKLVPDVKCKYYYVEITNKNLVNKAISKFKPDVVIHTAAIATPDYCDKHQDEARKVNVDGTKNIIDACKEYGSSIVYITTNGVYDGEKPPYDEDSVPNPLDHYGMTKFEGEKLVKNSGLKYIIDRLITMYGWNNPNERQNPATWLLEILGKNKTPVNMVADMYNNFLFVESAAKAILKSIILNKYNQVYNIAGLDCISRYDLSVKIAETFKMDKSMIYPVTLDFFKNFVQRPKNTCFSTVKMKNVLKIAPVSVDKGLRTMKRKQIDYSFWKLIK